MDDDRYTSLLNERYFPPLVCHRCGAMVHHEQIDTHNAFHIRIEGEQWPARLRNAVPYEDDPTGAAYHERRERERRQDIADALGEHEFEGG